MNYIDATVSSGTDLQVGHFSVIEKNVKLGNNVLIGNNVTIWPGTIIGDGVQIGDGSVVGKQPKPSKTSTVKYDSAMLPLVVGANTTIGTNTVLYAGSTIGENSLIADLASVREKCVIGNFVVVGRGVSVENGTQIGDYTKIQTGAYITGYMDIADHVFIAPMVTFTNDNFMGRTDERFKYIKGATIERGARIGGGAVILPGIKIAEETFIAAGALVTKDTPSHKVIKGLPAKEYRDVPPKELLRQQGGNK
ncbi:MAG: DapH/DapD/GlmU-related protein [Sporomusaceae bacterium]|nr:DapH/DapD/GlmU-related protein [Sporomusaceae bacterium]